MEEGDGSGFKKIETACTWYTDAYGCGCEARGWGIVG